VAAETIALIRELAAANRLWGAERIRGELLKLGIPVAKTTVQRHRRGARPPRRGSQTWATFLRNHAHEIWACDFVRPVTNHQIPSAGRRGSEGGLWGTTLTQRRKPEGTRAWVEKRGPPKVCRRMLCSPARYGKRQTA
jgi:hypothetical protein